MVSLRPINFGLKAFRAWQIGLACLLATGATFVVLCWCIAPVRRAEEKLPQATNRLTGEQASSFRPPYRMPDFEVPDLNSMRAGRPRTQREVPGDQYGKDQSSLVGVNSTSETSPSVTKLPSPVVPSMPPVDIPGTIPGGLSDMTLQASPGMPPSPSQLSPNFRKKLGGFVGPDPFALMPRGAGPDPEIFARLHQVEMPRPPALPPMPAPPKGHLDQINRAVQEARQRLSEPHPGEAPPLNFRRSEPQPFTNSHPPQLPQG